MPLSRCLAALLLSALLLSACSGPREGRPVEAELPDAFPSHTAEQVLFYLGQAGDSLMGLRADAQLNLRAPERSGSFNADIRMQRGDSLLLSVGKFGITGLRALVTADSFYVYDVLEGEVTYGSLDDVTAALPAALTAEDAFGNLLGLLRPDPTIDWEIEATDEAYTLTSPDERRIYTVAPGLWRVTRYEERSADGEVVDLRVFEDFEELGGAVLPRRLRFQQPERDATVQLFYRDAQVNPTGLSFALRAPASARRLPASE